MKTLADYQHIAILGAAGKMGSGIALLLLQELSLHSDWSLILLDVNSKGFTDLRKYLRSHLLKYAERNINALRKKYQNELDLIDNGEIIEHFLTEAFDRVNCVTSPEECRGVQLIFEAIAEEVNIKTEMFKRINAFADPQAYYFTNTSSIPIQVLEEKSQLAGRLIGFHFYNPPPIQKLVELIVPKNCQKDLQALSLNIAKSLNKTVVPSNDIAGFIGNGHFIREIQNACRHVRVLRSIIPALDALYSVNRISQEFLLRPMGIFQLIDYVGIDVCQHIASVMTQFLSPDFFEDAFIESMLKSDVRGGQNPDGSQKDGFFHYEKGQPVAVYDLQNKKYVPCTGEEWDQRFEYHLGLAPEGCLPWKTLVKDSQRESLMNDYFRHLMRECTFGAEIAQSLLAESRAIAYGLVEDNVAHSIEDVDQVLQLGFYHLYGVDAPFMASEKAGSIS